MSTIVMRVDLECDKCYKKIRKVLCKLQGQLPYMLAQQTVTERSVEYSLM
jgi:copper chaperone CopZ